MSAAGSGILTREEITALQDSLAAARSEGETRAGLLGDAAGAEYGGDPRLREAFDRGVEALGRGLSADFQAHIRVQVLSQEDIELGEVEQLVAGPEQVVSFQIEGVPTPGALIVSRSLFFDWLNRTLGGKPGERPETMGTRPYTRIEKRMLQKLAREWLATLTETLPGAVATCEVAPVRALRRWSTTPVVWWSVAVEGLGEMGRLRVAWPLALPSRSPSSSSTLPADRDPFKGPVLDAPVVLRAEVGSARVPLARLTSLQVGDVIPLDGGDRGTLAVFIEGRHKFDAIRGAVGNRAALQIVGNAVPIGGETGG